MPLDGSPKLFIWFITRLSFIHPCTPVSIRALTYYTICSVFGIVFHLKITLLKIVSAHSIHKIIICCYHNKIRWPNPI